MRLEHRGQRHCGPLFFLPSFPRKRESIVIFAVESKMDSRLRGNDAGRGKAE